MKKEKIDDLLKILYYFFTQTSDISKNIQAQIRQIFQYSRKITAKRKLNSNSLEVFSEGLKKQFERGLVKIIL